MATQPKAFERRRAERVLIRVPIRLRPLGGAVQQPQQDAEAVVVSRYGALLRSPAPLTTGATVELVHVYSNQTETFRVIWVGTKQAGGQHDVGVELVVPREDFWGIRFPPREHAP